MNKMVVGQYYPSDRFVHRLDSRTKIIAIFNDINLYHKRLFNVRFDDLITFIIILLTKVPVIK